MDRLSDSLPAKQPPRDASCPEHGAFQSQNLIRNVWSKCPACSARKDAEQRAEDERILKLSAERRHRDMLDAASIPNRFIGSTFTTFIADTPAKTHALTLARDYAENFAEHSKRGAVLIFAGKPGTGKSHLAGAILQAVLTPNVRYVTCMDLIRMVRETWRKDSERSETQVLRYLEGLDLLVVDEVGMQYGTEGEQTILFDVLDRRYREVRPMVLLTNQNRDGFKSFVGDRIYDRLVETSRWVPFDWDSYRGTARKQQ
jgi:DNA replication protein DnaC